MSSNLVENTKLNSVRAGNIYPLREVDIAIIGMAGRFPGANSIEEFWSNLVAGKESISRLTDQQLAQAGVEDAVVNEGSYIAARGLLEGAERFDAEFFGITPRDARLLDPQHRIFLECSWEALERAGYCNEDHRGAVGVYAGTGYNTYAMMASQHAGISSDDLRFILAQDKDFLATRAAYKLNLRGPAISVQTACSTSLVAVHLACQGLLGGDCDIALAGGVSIHYPFTEGYLFQQGSILSPDGHCRTFDKDAQGTVNSSGVALVVLKSAQQALRDGDHIHAIIRATAVNNDGSEKIGFTAPQIRGQAEVIRKAQRLAEVDVDAIGYVEAHGTGTALGDPIEVAALTEAFRASTRSKQFCGIGSVKSNLGHLDAAAGVTGLIKAALSLERELIPASLHFEEANSRIDFESSPFYVQESSSVWERGASSRVAAVSSFGLGGTNAHAILMEAPQLPEHDYPELPVVLPFSGRSEQDCCDLRDSVLGYLRDNPEVRLGDAAHSLQLGRKAFSNRQALVLPADFRSTNIDPNNTWPKAFSRSTEASVSMALLFSGQGSQQVNCGKQLLQQDPHFAADLKYFLDCFSDVAGTNLTAEFMTDQGAAPEKMHDSLNGHAFIFSIEMALVLFWQRLKVQPRAVLGHSLGEFAAACMAGIFEAEAIIPFLVSRSRLIEAQPRGAMLAVASTAEECTAYITDSVDIALRNAKKRTVLSGSQSAVELVGRQLEAAGIPCTLLPSTFAFHSSLMDPVAAELAILAEDLEFSAPQIPYISSMTGRVVAAEEICSPQYWAQQVRQPVQFMTACETLRDMAVDCVLELGPSETVSGFFRSVLPRPVTCLVQSVLPRTGQNEPELLHVLKSVAAVWEAGIDIDWSGMPGSTGRRITLPTYPFKSKPYLIEPAAAAVPATESQNDAVFSVEECLYRPVWKEKNGVDLKSETESALKTWLVFVDKLGIAAAVVEQLRREGHTVIELVAGQTYARTGTMSFELDPGDPDSYKLLCRSLAAEQLIPQSILHMWSLSSEADTELDAGSLYAEMGLGYIGVTEFVRQFAPFSSNTVELTIVNCNSERVLESDSVNPVSASMRPLPAVLFLELPGLSCQLLDVPVRQNEMESTATLSENILLKAQSITSQQVQAYRNGKWLERHYISAADGTSSTGEAWKTGGVYLLTAGFGGIAEALSLHLAKSFQPTLILLSRTALPERSLWSQLNELEPESLKAKKIRHVLELESLGARVVLLHFDCSQSSEILSALRAEPVLCRIDGIVHTAGIPAQGGILSGSTETTREVLKPKIEGTLTTIEICRELEVGWVMLCSSLAAFTGGFGESDYAAGNAFLDAVSESFHGRAETDFISINWDTWREQGMAVDAHRKRVEKEGTPVDHPLLDQCLVRTPRSAVFQTVFDMDRFWVLSEHVIGGKGVLPGTGVLEMVRAAFAEMQGTAAVELSSVVFFKPVAVVPGQSRVVYTILEQGSDGYSFSVLSWSTGAAGGVVEHARGSIMLCTDSAGTFDLNELREMCSLREIIDQQDPYEKFGPHVYNGPRWDTVRKVNIGENRALMTVKLAAEFVADVEAYCLHPSLLDTSNSYAERINRVNRVPFWYKRLCVWAPLPAAFYSLVVPAREHNQQDEMQAFNVSLIDPEGRELVRIEEYTYAKVSGYDDFVQQEHEHAPTRPLPAYASRAVEKYRLGPNNLTQPALEGLSNDQGIAAINTVLSRRDFPRLIVSTVAPEQQAEKTRIAVGQQHDVATNTATRSAVTIVQPNSPASLAGVQSLLTSIWESVLGFDAIGLEDNFFELGGDSFLGIQIVAEAGRANLAVNPAQMFQYPTIKELAEQIYSGSGSSPEPVGEVLAFSQSGLAQEDLQRLLFELEQSA